MYVSIVNHSFRYYVEILQYFYNFEFRNISSESIRKDIVSTKIRRCFVYSEIKYDTN